MILIVIIILNTWYDFITKFKGLMFSNNMNIMIMYDIIVILRIYNISDNFSTVAGIIFIYIFNVISYIE